MNVEKIGPGRGTSLRKNNSQQLTIIIKQGSLNELFIIKGSSLLTKNILESNLIISPNEYYMIMNTSVKNELEIHYDQDISIHQVVYDPYKYEKNDKIALNIADVIKQYEIPKNYIDVLSKWYSIKFSYPNYNFIFIKPELAISFQFHDNRNEIWEILKGKPIIIVGNQVYYHVKRDRKFKIPINTIHSVINPNPEEFVLIKEGWTGDFDEEDIFRIFNPNNSK